MGAFGVRCVFSSSFTLPKTFLLRVCCMDDFARLRSSNQCEWRFLHIQRMVFSYCTFLLRFRVLESVTPCKVRQPRHLKLCLVTPVNVCVRASDERRKLGGHGYWFWCDQCCTTRWAEVRCVLLFVGTGLRLLRCCPLVRSFWLTSAISGATSHDDRHSCANHCR